MPYRSSAQRAYMHIHLPEIAARWDREYSSPKNLPKHAKKRQKAKRNRRLYQS